MSFGKSEILNPITPTDIPFIERNLQSHFRGMFQKRPFKRYSERLPIPLLINEICSGYGAKSDLAGIADKMCNVQIKTFRN